MSEQATIALNAQSLSPEAGGDVPEWIHLLPVGEGLFARATTGGLTI